jgi:hypothetical protein
MLLIGKLQAENGNELPTLVLNRISELKEYESTHVTISVSGFLSGDTDKKEHWVGLVKHLQGHSTDIDANAFSLTWEAGNRDVLLKSIGKAVSGLAVKGAVSFSGGPIGKVGLMMLAKEGFDDVKEVQ